QVDLPCRERPSDEVIQNNVEAHPRRKAVSGGWPQIDWTKPVVRQARDVAFGHHLRFAIGGNGIEISGLIDHRLPRLTVVAAGRSEHEAADANPFGKLSQADACTMIDVVGEARV